MKWRVNPRVRLLAVAGALAASLTWVHAQQRGGATVAIDGDDIGGVVASAKGPEARVGDRRNHGPAGEVRAGLLTDGWTNWFEA